MGLNFLIWVLNFGSKSYYGKIAFCMGCFQKTTCTSGAPARATVLVERQLPFPIDAFEAILSILQWETVGIWSKSWFYCALAQVPHTNLKNQKVKKSDDLEQFWD